MGTRNVGHCASTRAGGSAHGSRKLNQIPRPDVYVSYSEDPNDYSKREACHARHPLGLIPPHRSRPGRRQTTPVPTADKEHIVRDTHWG
jgi:hypothetical protein